jgi:ubiquinone/menaquinone biosynthesis C-methylase UbiE
VENAFDDKTQSILLKSGLKAGFSCLEVGPGAGSILKWMKEIVGPTGSVTGVDKNIEHVRHLIGPSIELLEGLIQDMRFSHTFDLIHTRYVLIHDEQSLSVSSGCVYNHPIFL